MISPSQLIGFVTAATILALIPGPGILFVLAQTVRGGRSAGFSSATGTAIGGMAHVLAGAVGLSAIVYSSSTVFEGAKIAGAIYLFILGYKALRAQTVFSAEVVEAMTLRSDSIKQGIATEVLNPKTALFFLALIPQFIPTGGNIAVYFVVFGTISVALNTLADLIVVFSANYLMRRQRRSRNPSKFFGYFASVAYFAIGVLALKADRK